MPFPIYNHIGDDHFVHIGSKIAVRHLNTGGYIRSTNRNYQGGSGQQIVYAASQQPEHEDWWQVSAPFGQNVPHGNKIPYGTHVRLYHMATFRWLHSHNVRSADSGQNEVSCFGDENTSDLNDNWIVEKDDGGSGDWHANDVFLFRHEITGAYLHSHDIKSPGLNVGNVNEVTTCATVREDANNRFGINFG